MKASRGAVTLLGAAGFDAVHAGDLDLLQTDDRIILDTARADGRVVVTLDADFHAQLALSGASTPTTIRIRIEGLKSEGLAKLLLHVLDQCSEELRAEAMVTVELDRIRIRRLPLIH